LDHLDEQADGRWELKKVNVDEHPEVARQYNVQGIPIVKLFHNGEALNLFQRAKPEPEIRTWLEENLPTRGKKKLQEAKNHLKNSKREEAPQALEEAVQQELELEEARVYLAREIVMEEPERAEQLVNNIYEDSPHHQTADDVSTLSYLLTDSTDNLESSAVKDDYVNGVHSLRDQRFEDALQHFIEVVKRNKKYDQGGARKGCIGIFDSLGEEHERTKGYRRTFDMALF